MAYKQTIDQLRNAAPLSGGAQPEDGLGLLNGAADNCHSTELLHQPQEGPLFRADHTLGHLDLQGDELGNALAAHCPAISGVTTTEPRPIRSLLPLHSPKRTQRPC